MPVMTPAPAGPTAHEAAGAAMSGPAPQQRPELVSLANDIRLACMRISRRVRFESDRELPPHQFSVLARLAEQPRTNSELAEIERVSAPSMKRTTACLVDEGLVARTDDPQDRRQVILSLTDAGRGALDRVRRHRDEWMLERFACLSDDEIELLDRASAVLAKVATK